MDVTDNKCENGETKENKAKGKQAKIAKVVAESSEKVEQSSPVKLLHDDVPIRYICSNKGCCYLSIKTFKSYVQLLFHFYST